MLLNFHNAWFVVLNAVLIHAQPCARPYKHSFTHMKPKTKTQLSPSEANFLGRFHQKRNLKASRQRDLSLMSFGGVYGGLVI